MMSLKLHCNENERQWLTAEIDGDETILNIFSGEMGVEVPVVLSREQTQQLIDHLPCKGSMQAHIDNQAARIAELEQQIKSQLVCDGLPTFYISEAGMVCTHRLSESDTPVWCRTGDDGLKAMSAIQPTRNIGQVLYEDLVSLQAINNAHDGSTEVHDAIAALISKIDMPTTAEPSGNAGQLNTDKAEAVFKFVNMMIGALECGFVDDNNPTLAQVHQTARHHVKDNYGIDHPNIVAEWGQDAAELCGIKQPQEPAQNASR